MKFTEQEIKTIRERIGAGEKITVVAKDFGTYPQLIRYWTKDQVESKGPVWTNKWVKTDDGWKIEFHRYGEYRGEGFVDDADHPDISKRKWRIGYLGYAVTTIGHSPIEMHRYLYPAPSRKQVDFINRNKLDCRRGNLRHVTPALNLENTRRTDGYEHRIQRSKGSVKHMVKVNQWDAYIGKSYLGRFNDEATAEKAVKAARWWFEKFQVPRGDELISVYERRIVDWLKD